MGHPTELILAHEQRTEAQAIPASIDRDGSTLSLRATLASGTCRTGTLGVVGTGELSGTYTYARVSDTRLRCGVTLDGRTSNGETHGLIEKRSLQYWVYVTPQF